MPTFRRAAASCALFVSIAAAPASAQVPPDEHQPIGRFAVDVRGVSAKYPTAPALATFLGVEQEELVSRGIGLVVGAQAYPLRLGRHMAFGVGGELFVSRGRKTIEPEQTHAPDGPTVEARLSAVLPQISLNFGGRNGWSYITAGIGSSKFSSNLVVETPAPPTTTVEDNPRTSTLHYGGGARWFVKKHVAFSLDLRFYAVRPQEATETRPALPRTRLVILSAGMSFR